MAQASATKVGELAPPLELRDTDGAIHALPTPGEVPATVVVWTCNHCPYALAWHDRIVQVARDYEGRGVRFLAVNSNDAGVAPPASNRIRLRGRHSVDKLTETVNYERAHRMQASVAPSIRDRPSSVNTHGRVCHGGL